MRVELSLTIPMSVYEKLQAVARREKKSVDVLLTELISQRFPPSPDPMGMKNKRDGLYAYPFVTDWALPPPFEPRASVEEKQKRTKRVTDHDT